MTDAEPTDQSRRAAVRRLATGVTVLTAVHGDRAHGTTASAVLAVSRDPLLIGVCLRTGSAFAELAARAGRFAVNVLSGRQAAIADWFADPQRPAGYGQFAPVDWEPDPGSGAPLLCGAVAWLDCRPAEIRPAGAHSILLAEVLGGSSGPGGPLLSFERRLHSAELHDVARRRTPASAAAGITTFD
jgi:flavin reductase (DIM6/NTAB) family NADH-FMN oxidoreductase RutF